MYPFLLGMYLQKLLDRRVLVNYGKSFSKVLGNIISIYINLEGKSQSGVPLESGCCLKGPSGELVFHVT